MESMLRRKIVVVMVVLVVVVMMMAMEQPMLWLQADLYRVSSEEHGDEYSKTC